MDIWALADKKRWIGEIVIEQVVDNHMTPKDMSNDISAELYTFLFGLCSFLLQELLHDMAQRWASFHLRLVMQAPRRVLILFPLI